VVKINAGKDRIEQAVPAIVDRSLQEHARATLAENKRFSGGPAKCGNYLLTGFVRCEVRGVRKQLYRTGHHVKRQEVPLHTSATTTTPCGPAGLQSITPLT
jgi:hypothetical protein